MAFPGSNTGLGSGRAPIARHRPPIDSAAAAAVVPGASAQRGAAEALGLPVER